MNKLFKVFLILITLVTIQSVNAEETPGEETTAKCTYAEKAEMNKKAGKVKTAYDVEKQADGSYRFYIRIYNLVEGLNANITASIGKHDITEEIFGEEMLIASYMDTENGTYTIISDDITRPIIYEIELFGDGECTNTLKKLRITKPMRNKYHDYDVCKFDSTEENKYCLEWITSEITLPEEKVIQKIEDSKSNIKTHTTTKCANCDEIIKNAALNQRKKVLKIALVAAIAIIIVINMFYIYFRIDAVRRSSL